MHQALAERFVEALAHPVLVPGGTDGLPPPPAAPGEAESPRIDTRDDSFLDLLAGLEQRPEARDRSGVVAAYHAWIGRNSRASPSLFAAWFNLGVEQAGAGDKAAASDAYRTALSLRPDFHPAALNLGVLLESAGQPDSALAIWQQALQPEETRAALLGHRERLAGACRAGQPDAAEVLHVGCGAYAREKLPPLFRHAGWREIRLDIDPEVQPDLVASITDMHVVTDGQVDAVYSSHNIEHLHPHDVPQALQEMHRVLKPSGFLLITLPDLQEVARHVAEGRLEDPLYISSMGPISPLDILYGHRPSLAAGNLFMAHRTGFTGGTLAAALIRAGFAAAIVQRDPPAYSLTAIGFRSRPDDAGVARAQAEMLPATGHPALLYTQND